MFLLFAFAITAITLVINYFVLSETLFPLLKIKKVNRRLRQQGIEADAVLLNMEQTGLYVDNQPQIKLQLQVHPSSGRNFISETREVFSLVDLSQLRIGSTLKVKYNPVNTKEVMVVRN